MKHLSKKQRYLLSILSGLLMVISFPFTGSLTPLVFIAWVPLLLVEHSISTSHYRSRKVFTHAYLTFFIYNFGTTWWIWNADEVGAVMAFVFNSFLMAIAFQLFHFCKKHIGRKEGYIGFLLIWIGFEYAHYHWELSWPWLTFGNTFSIHPAWVQWYSYTGALGGTFWILLVNLFVFRIIENKYIKRESWNIQTPLFIITSLIVVVPLVASLITYSNYEENGRSTEIIVTQPNIDPYNDKFGGMEPIQQLNKITELAKQKMTSKTQLVLAPETAIPFPFNEAIYEEIPPFEVLDSAINSWQHADLLIGASTLRYFDRKRSRATKPNPYNDGEGFIEYYNTSVFMQKDKPSKFLHKSKLVLAAEIVPFSNWFPAMEELSLNLGGTGTGTLGIEKEPTNFNGQKFTFAPVICYESVYGEFVAEQCRKGAEVICIITNDGWWDDTPGYKQHMSFARLRAIENRRCVARSANTGTSCFINQRGDVLQQSTWWTETALRETIKLNTTSTFYSLQGDGIGRVFAFVASLLILLAIVRKIKPRNAPTE